MSAPTVLLNDFRRQWEATRTDVAAAVEEVGRSGWYILGREVESFERALAGTFGCRHAAGCASGLDAIEIALRALGVEPGDKVLTTPMSAFATTLAILRAGAVPVFVDTDDRGLIDLDLCEEHLEADRTIRFFVPVHLYGHALDLDRLETLRDRYRLWVVEDCAQSILARWGDRPAGTVGQVSATSFYPTKNLGALGDGGAVLTDDPELHARCAALRNYGQSSRYVHDLLGLNSRLDELQAAIMARAFLPRLAVWTERRRAIAQAYRDAIRSPAVRVLSPPRSSRSSWHLFPVAVAAGRREAFRAYLKGAGIQTAIHYPRLITDQKALSSDAPFEVVGDLSRARRVAAEEVSLPIHPFLSDDEIERVAAAANSWDANSG